MKKLPFDCKVIMAVTYAGIIFLAGSLFGSCATKHAHVSHDDITGINERYINAVNYINYLEAELNNAKGEDYMLDVVSETDEYINFYE